MSSAHTKSNHELVELSLFPLNLVLFPGMSLPLRIFEERYKLMISECLEKNLPFGVVLIKEGMEVGGLAEPHKVGTTARIIKSERQEGGQYSLQTIGEKRFGIHQITQETPFLVGKVEYLEDEVPNGLGNIVTKTRKMLGSYWKALASIKGGWIREVQTPEDPVSLSYAIAQSVAMPALVGQYLLQMSSVKERMERATPLLQERLDMAQKKLQKLLPYQGPRLN